MLYVVIGFIYISLEISDLLRSILVLAGQYEDMDGWMDGWIDEVD